MNWEQITGGLKQMISRVNAKSNELTDEDLAIIAKQRDHLLGLLQKTYRCEKKQAEQELDWFTRRLQVARSHDGSAAGTDNAGSTYQIRQGSHATQAQ